MVFNFSDRTVRFEPRHLGAYLVLGGRATASQSSVKMPLELNRKGTAVMTWGSYWHPTGVFSPVNRMRHRRIGQQQQGNID